MPQSRKTIKIPIRVIKREVRKRFGAVRLLQKLYRKAGVAVLAVLLFSGSAFLLSAFEAHIVNVTARICNYSQTRTIGFWKTHPSVYAPLLPQTLGAEPCAQVIDSAQKVNDIFTAADSKEMIHMLKAQLLGMKFNVAYFGIGGYEVESEGNKTIDQIVAEADELVCDQTATRQRLEEMKNLLDYLNTLHQVRYCSGRIVPLVMESLLINEVYYDVDDSHGAETWNEWIEVYNPNDQPVDISGWRIADNSGTETVIPISSPIPGQGFAVITPRVSTWNYWDGISPATVKIVLGKKIGSGLSNEGDRVVLKDADGIEVDATSYGDDTYAFTPAVNDAAEGHSIARKPAGYDTNQASDWVDNGLPNPGDGADVSQVTSKNALSAESAAESVPAQSFSASNEQTGSSGAAAGSSIETGTASAAVLTETAATSSDVSTETTATSSPAVSASDSGLGGLEASTTSGSSVNGSLEATENSTSSEFSVNGSVSGAGGADVTAVSATNSGITTATTSQ